MADLAQQAGMSDGAKEKAERDARWVGDFADNLTVAIALREWEKAVSLVEEGEKKMAVTSSLATKLPPLSASLTASLLQALSNPNNIKSAVVRLIHLLIRLHAGPAARMTFLSARAETIRRLVRMIKFEGQIGIYVNDLAVVMFTAIKHTADWYLTSFKENEDASGMFAAFD
jgi:exocyst complex component 8